MSDGIFDPNVKLNEIMVPVPTNELSNVGDEIENIFQGVDVNLFDKNKEYLVIGILLFLVIAYYVYNNISKMNESLKNMITIEQEKKK